MAKQKIQIKDIRRDNFRKHLIMFHPFLSKEFRAIKASEIHSKKVYEEIFPGEEFLDWKLKAIYEFQK